MYWLVGTLQLHCMFYQSTKQVLILCTLNSFWTVTAITITNFDLKNMNNQEWASIACGFLVITFFSFNMLIITKDIVEQQISKEVKNNEAQ